MKKSVWRRVLTLMAAIVLSAGFVSIPAEAKQTDQYRFGQITVSPWEAAYLQPNGTVSVSGNYADTDVSDWKNMAQVQYGEYILYGVTKQGSVIAADREMGEKLSGWKHIKSIAVSRPASFENEEFILGLLENGKVTAYVPDGYSLGKISSWKNITAIAAGDAHAVGLRKDGTVAAVGSNEDGQCNVSGWRNVVAVAAGKKLTVGLQADGKVLVAGALPLHEKEQIAQWKEIKAIAVGYRDYVLGLQEDGQVKWSRLLKCNSVAFEGPEGLPANWTHVESVFGSNNGLGAFRTDGSMLLIGSMQTSAAMSCALTDRTDQHVYYFAEDWPNNRTLTCDLCGKEATIPAYLPTSGCQHYWVEAPGFGESDFNGSFYVRKMTCCCIHCGDFWEYTIPRLTELTVTRDSNAKNKKDIQVGTWEMNGGAVDEDALRFWVVNKEGYHNTEYVEYKLNGEYALLQCWAGIEISSKPNTDISFTVYGDGKKLAVIRLNEDFLARSAINVEGISTLQISCTNKSSSNGYGVFGGCLFPAEYLP